MATVTLAQEHNSYIVYNRQVSTDSGWENPFRPGGDLSREADEIVELIKEGKPITPTPGSTSPKLGQLLEDRTDNGSALPNNETTSLANKITNDLMASPKIDSKNATVLANSQPNANGKSMNNDKGGGTQDAVEVQRATVEPASGAGQVEFVVIKKKPKCQCCVIQ